MVRMIVGALIGFLIGGMFWFPTGIYYTVQAATDSELVRLIAIIKGLLMW